MIVFHGAGGKAQSMAGTFGPYAATHDVIMLFPQAYGGWSDKNFVGPLYNTKNNVQLIFLRQIMDHLGKPFDNRLDYSKPNKTN